MISEFFNLLIAQFILDPSAYETAWIIGDSFLASTYQKGFKNQDGNYYIKESYGLHAFHNDQHLDKNLLSRVRNVLVAGFNKLEKLPKFIIVAMDNDILNFIDNEDYGVSCEIGKLMDSLVDNLNLVLTTRKSQLPRKSLKETHFIWVGSPLHPLFEDNALRVKLNACMESIIPKYRNMSFLFPRKGWSLDNSRIYLNGSFTAEGCRMYWKSVDAAVKFWLMKGCTQIVQKGPGLNILAGKGNNENLAEEIKNADPVTGIIKFRVENPVEEFFRKRRIENRSLDDLAIRRPKFDKYHWYRNNRDMERGQGELRRKQATPKRFKRKLQF